MNEVYFIVDGRVQPKQRPRVVRRRVKVGKDYVTKTMTYTPDATHKYEEKVRSAYIDAVEGQDVKLEGALSMTVNIYCQIPKSTPKKTKTRMICGEIRPATHTGDIDNLFKAISDALNGLAYEDDSQIVEGVVRKFYSETARAEVTIREVDG